MNMKLEIFLISNKFQIPSYQRDFTWTEKQMQDLFDDIQEAITTGSTHYIGTFILAGVKPNYDIVDGQQRLSTLTLIIHALLAQLDPKDSYRIINEANLLYQSHNSKELKLDLGANASFVKDLLEGLCPKPSTIGQRRLKNCYLFARERAKSLFKQGGKDLIEIWIDTIKNLELIIFIEQDTGRAIRMFQTVNDRGLPLTTMDKTKALLIFYSNCYLGGALDNKINHCFKICFDVYDELRQFVQNPGYRIDNIARNSFTEDDILRYHYLAYSYNNAENIFDYNGYIQTVFDGFLKNTLKKFSTCPSDLRSFIDNYITDLEEFSTAFLKLIQETKTNPRVYKLFVILGLSSRLYPLAIRLYQRNLLFTIVPHNSLDLLDCLEICDIRVYKTRGTDPAKDIGLISHKSQSASVYEIANSLGNFVFNFMPCYYFDMLLSEDMYNNQATPLIFLEYDEFLLGRPYSISELVKFVENELTREHIIPQAPTSNVTSYGFTDTNDFNVHINKLGNLTLLAKNENSRCQNKPVHIKLTDTKYYASSTFAGTRDIAHKHTSGTFNKADINDRTKQIKSFILSRYPIWKTC